MQDRRPLAGRDRVVDPDLAPRDEAVAQVVPAEREVEVHRGADQAPVDEPDGAAVGGAEVAQPDLGPRDRALAGGAAGGALGAVGPAQRAEVGYAARHLGALDELVRGPEDPLARPRRLTVDPDLVFGDVSPDERVRAVGELDVDLVAHP